MRKQKDGSAAGYSGTPLARKLGIGPGARVRVDNAPDDYLDLVAPLPDGVKISPRLRQRIHIWHVFTRSRAELRRTLARARETIDRDGMVWVSWPKKSSGVPSQITEDTVRALALPLGFVDVKVCAVDQTWSALKLVVRKHLRGD